MIFRVTMLLTFVAGPAAAHGTLPGGGGFYSGALHPIVAMDHLIALLALGLLMGRAQMRLPLAGLATGLTVGLMLAMPLPWVQIVVLVLAMAFGALLAVQVQPPLAGVIGGALTLGLAIGADTDTGVANAGIAAGAGTFVAAMLIVLNAFALAGLLRPPPRSIVLRVAGSWILAIALLVLALRVAGSAT